jgi:hypothetical protein
MSHPIEAPSHYTQHDIECIEVLEALNLPFHLSNVIKYIWRHREKGGMEDLMKAKWYLDRYIEENNPDIKGGSNG